MEQSETNDFEVVYSALETNEIFEKEQRDIVIQKINNDFGNHVYFENKSGNTTIAGQTKWILEKKYVWKISNLDVFLKDLPVDKKSPNSQDFDRIFKRRIQTVCLVGLECDELPYFQVMLFVELSNKSKIPVIIDSYRLIAPFQKYLEHLGGLSLKAYSMSKIKPRFHSHHIIHSNDYLKLGLERVMKLAELQQSDEKFKIAPSELSKSIRELPILSSFNLPTIMSAVDIGGGVLSFVTHHEQFGGGGEIDSCGITFTDRPSVCVPEFESQGIEKEIKMFSPNTNVFFSVIGGMNIHLFLSGLSTWLSYFEITRNGLDVTLENQRELIQKLLNDNQISKIKKFQNKISQIQGNNASMGILLNSVKNQTIDQIEELSTRTGVLGITEIPIPQKEHDIFSNTLIHRIGGQAYFELISTSIKNNFSNISSKLLSLDNPSNKMTDFIFNQTSLNLQKTINKNSIIEIILAIIIGTFTFVSVKSFFGL